MRNIVVVDIDGTIAKIGDRLKYITGQNPKDYNSFYDHVEEDEPITNVLDIVLQLARNYRIVFCTGRAERCREQTERWLRHYICMPFDYKLLMRRNGDHRHDVDVKPQLLKKASIFPNQAMHPRGQKLDGKEMERVRIHLSTG